MKFTLNKKQSKQTKSGFSIPSLNITKKKGIALKYKFLIGILTIIFLSGGMFLILFYINQWFNQNQLIFQSPIIVQTQSPILIEKRKTIIAFKMSDPMVNKVHAQGISQVPSWKIIPNEVNKEEWNYIMSQADARLVSWIWKKESNYGRDQVMGSLDNYCRSHGQENQFGLGGMQDMTCFDTFDENVQAVIKTLTSYGDMSDFEKLCYYNVGEKINNCSYVIGY